jgi:hypothetical protein
VILIVGHTYPIEPEIKYTTYTIRSAT